MTINFVLTLERAEQELRRCKHPDPITFASPSRWCRICGALDSNGSGIDWAQPHWRDLLQHGCNTALVRRTKERYEPDQPCCYGAVQLGGELETDRFRFPAIVQRPFRGQWLWLWGNPSAKAVSLRIANHEQLPRPVSFGDVGVSPETFLKLVRPATNVPFGVATAGRKELITLYGTEVKPELYDAPEARALVLPSMAPGCALEIVIQGRGVRGFALIGVQVP